MRTAAKTFGIFALVFALCALAHAQQPKKVPRIGVLRPASLGTARQDGFRQGLVELGYIEGQNILVEYRNAEEQLDRLPELAAELVRLKVDVIFAKSTPAVQAAKKATTTVPIPKTKTVEFCRLAANSWKSSRRRDRKDGRIACLCFT